MAADRPTGSRTAVPFNAVSTASMPVAETACRIDRASLNIRFLRRLSCRLTELQWAPSVQFSPAVRSHHVRDPLSSRSSGCRRSGRPRNALGRRDASANDSPGLRVLPGAVDGQWTGAAAIARRIHYAERRGLRRSLFFCVVVGVALAHCVRRALKCIGGSYHSRRNARSARLSRCVTVFRAVCGPVVQVRVRRPHSGVSSPLCRPRIRFRNSRPSCSGNVASTASATARTR